MSVRTEKVQAQISQAHTIAQRNSAREYFLSEEERLLKEWADKSNQLFRFTGEVLKNEYQLKSSQLVERYGEQYEELYGQSRKEFEAYCILNRKVQKKSDQIENFAAFFNSRNHKRTFFGAWKAHTERSKYLRRMEDRSQKWRQMRTLKTCLKSWLGLTMESNRNKIKNEVLQRTEIQITKIQTDYEKLIHSLEEVLEKKLIDLKKEEEEHKLLHDKYEAMYTRAKMDNM